jgi:hypothetical protein
LVRDLPAAPVIPLNIGGAAYPVGPIVTEGLPSAREPQARAWAVLHQVLDPEKRSPTLVFVHRPVQTPTWRGC